MEKLDSSLGKYRELVHKLRGTTGTRTLAVNRKYLADKESVDNHCNELLVQVEQAERAEKERGQRLDTCIRKIANAEAELSELIRNPAFDCKLLQ